MRIELRNYLQNIRENLRLSPREEGEILCELENHVEDRCQELQGAGLTEKESLEKSLDLLGSAREVARQYYDSHSQNTWRQALLAGMPHLFFMTLFLLNWLNGLTWLPVVMLVVGAIAIFGLTHGKPTWLFPWLGYSLLPVAAAGVSLLYLPAGWSWVTLVLYIPLVLWLSCFITIRFMRRDWLYAALMLLPMPTFVGWFMAPKQPTGFRLGFLSEYAPWMVFTFLVLACAATVFVRLKNRVARVLVLGVSGLLTLTVVFLVNIQIGIVAFFVLLLLFLSDFLVPAYIERREKRHQVLT